MSTMVYYVIAGLVFLFSWGVKQKLQSTYKQWSQVRNATDRPGGEIARIMKTNQGNVRVLVHRGLDRLRNDPIARQLLGREP